MASSFFGLYVSRDALHLAQKGLDITNHNMTNMSTPGYSRQRLDIVSVANNGSTLGYNSQIRSAGMGSEALGVTQIRNKLLDDKVRKYSAELCSTGARTSVLSDIEDILDDVENSESGMSGILADFKAAFQSFSSTGADRQDLSNVAMNAAESVINTLKNFDIRLDETEIDQRTDINTTNTRINIILKDIADLNRQIKTDYVLMDNIEVTYQGYMAENQYGPLELKDKLNYLCDELSQYININVEETLDGTFDVRCGTLDLVIDDKYAKMDIVYTGEQGEEDDFVQLFASSLNSSSQWIKARRELLPQYGEEMTAAVREINTLIEQGNIMDAFKKENALLNGVAFDTDGNKIKLPADQVEMYRPIFKCNYTSGEKAPSYAIEFTPATDIVSEGSVKGMFDMYNGKGCYAGYNENVYEIYDTDYPPKNKNSVPQNNTAETNQYKGTKYYQRTVKAFAETLVKEFNAIYDDVNNEAADKAEADYRAENGIGNADFDTLDSTDQNGIMNARAKAKFKMFDFENGEVSISNLKIADTWKELPLRAVHPKVTVNEKNGKTEIDYNYDELDNEYLNKILSVFDKAHKFGNESDEYTFEGFVQYYGNTVGSQLEYELGKFDSTNSMYNTVSTSREEVMGVNMDEEAVNMMNYQKWYNAISRMINALDECLDKLINGTGIVGR